MEDDVIPVIAVVDGPGGPDQGSMSRSWFDFRQRWPLRPFCLLRVEGGEDLLIPATLLRDPNVIFANINRDGDDEFKRSDWFDICNLENNIPLDPEFTQSVALLVDIDTPAVGESYQYFLERLRAFLGLQPTGPLPNLLQATPNQNGDWIQPPF